MYMDKILILLFTLEKNMCTTFSTKLRGLQSVNSFDIIYERNSILILLVGNIPSFKMKNQNEKHGSILWLFMKGAVFLDFFILKKV